LPTCGIGNLTGNSRSLDTLHGFQNVAGNRHQGRRIAGRNRGLRQAVLYLLHCHAHGRVFLAAQRDLQRVVHRNHFAGRNDTRPGMGEAGQGLGQSDQNQVRIGMLFEELFAGGQSDLGTMVASHAVDSDCDHGVTTQIEKNIRQ
jgi:hypothetical protein